MEARRPGSASGTGTPAAPRRARRPSRSRGGTAKGAAAVRRLRRDARRVFGWERMRPGQTEAMRAVLQRRDVLAVMPTGSGKSALYQVPALSLPGPTVIVSPLIALQRDQVAALRALPSAPPAAAVNSAQRAAETARAWRMLDDGGPCYLFLSPEQLSDDEVGGRLRDARPSLLVVDEAQCISSWGHDFRPTYLRIAAASERFGRPPVLALTATAAPPVRAEIRERLVMRDPVEIVTGFDRPNLRLSVERFVDDDAKRRAVVERAATLPKPGLVYTATRRDSERYAEELAALGLSVRAYHAGMRAAERNAVQRAFMAGDLDAVVATSAFGMGIDKADVRFVLHASVPGSPDEYYQEIGRAGRDGRPAEAVLFYRPEDLGLQRSLAAGGADSDAVRAVAGRLLDADAPMSAADLHKATGLTTGRVTAALNLMEQAGAVATDDAGRVRREPGSGGPDDIVRRTDALAEAHATVERSRIEMMRGYAETTGCRRAFLLGYFGEEHRGNCGACDRCAPPRGRPRLPKVLRRDRPGRAPRAARPSSTPAPFPVGTRVVHRKWGRGAVMRAEDDRLTVLFDTKGYRTLSLRAVTRRKILKRDK